MEKKAKIIATIGPSISSLSTLRKIIGLGVDAFRINFSHDLTNIKKIIQQIRSLEKKTSKNVSQYRRKTICDAPGTYVLKTNK